jgi:hypothetical protein
VDLIQNVGREICWKAPLRLHSIIKVNLMEMNVAWVMVEVDGIGSELCPCPK